MKYAQILVAALLLTAGAPAAYAVATIPGPDPDLADMLNHPDGYATIPSEPVVISPNPDTIKAEVVLFNLSDPGSGNPGGSLGGTLHAFSPPQGAFAQFTIFGEDNLAGFNRFIAIPLTGEAHLGPRVAGAPVQVFPTQMFQLQGEIFGDPDFDLLRITAGDGFGLPSPGQTTLTKLPDTTFNIDSFFDITYRIEWQGAPGSILDGLSDTHTGTSRFRLGEALDPAVPEPAGLWMLGMALLASRRKRNGF